MMDMVSSAEGVPAVVTGISTLAVSPAVKPDLLVTGARGSHAESRFLLVRVDTDAGVSGYGEVSGTLLWSGEDATTARHVIDHALRDVIVGLSLSELSEASARMDFVLAGHPFTKGGVSMALWDAHARSHSVPLVTALGGARREGVAIKCSLSGNGARLETGLRAAQAMGFESFKIKVGLDIDGDVARMRELRSLIGADAFIGLDANGGYTLEEAKRAIDELLPYSPAFLEQPVGPRLLADMNALRNRGLPIVADESVFDAVDLAAVIDAEAADVVSIYVGKSGGPAQASAMAEQAAQAGLDVIIGSNGELGVGAAAQLHVACAARSLSSTIPCDVIGGHYYTSDVVAQGVLSDGRSARLSADSGLGVRLRREIQDAEWVSSS